MMTFEVICEHRMEAIKNKVLKGRAWLEKEELSGDATLCLNKDMQMSFPYLIF